MDSPGPKTKRSRALGIALTPKAERYLASKSGPPGRAGRSGRTRGRKASDDKLQLLEKQRLRAQYNVGERQKRGYYRSASTKSGNTADRLIQLPESRVDTVVYRCGFVPTIYSARQLVSHGHVEVNGKAVNVPSNRLAENDVVSLTEKGTNQRNIYLAYCIQAFPIRAEIATLHGGGVIMNSTGAARRNKISGIEESDRTRNATSRAVS